MGMITVREHIEAALIANGESLADIEAHVFAPADTNCYGEVWAKAIEWDDTFDDRYGGIRAFTIWTKNYVYFPGVYESVEWVACVSRHPNGLPTKPVGGY